MCSTLLQKRRTKSLSFTLLVTGPPYGTENATSAYMFATACINSGHRLSNIFFYHAGVLNVNSFAMLASDEFDLVRAWHELSVKHSVTLSVCSGSALRRGMLDSKQAMQNGLKSSNVLSSATFSGLISLLEDIATSDRLMQF